MDLTLSDCVRYILVLLQEKKIPLPFAQYKPWHRLFYELKESTEFPEKPDFLSELQFEWDGPYPQAQELREFLHLLSITGTIVCDSPAYKNYRIPEDTYIRWKQNLETLDEATQNFLKSTAVVAEELWRE